MGTTRSGHGPLWSVTLTTYTQNVRFRFEPYVNSSFGVRPEE